MNSEYKLVILGRPATKKNSPVMVKGRNLLLPSKAYRAYEKAAKYQLVKHRHHIDYHIKVVCRYYLMDKRWWPDLIGLLQATSDILQKHEVISDDSLIVSYGDSCIAGLDKENPRVEICITRMEAPWDREG